jgi:hypothetical protein
MTGYIGHALTDRDHWLILCFPDATLYLTPADVCTILCKVSTAPLFRVDADGMMVETRHSISSSKHLIFIDYNSRQYIMPYRRVRELMASQNGRVMIQEYRSVVREALSGGIVPGVPV